MGSDIVERLREWADGDVMETARDGSFEYNDAVIWAGMMREAASLIEKLVEALKPSAYAADAAMDYEQDDEEVKVTLGSCRKARTLLQELINGK